MLISLFLASLHQRRKEQNMKITYNFNDESVEIDVPEEWGELVVQFNREEDTQDRI